jgi:LPXTG-site transpeptidase (sortase) family protein
MSRQCRLFLIFMLVIGSVFSPSTNVKAQTLSYSAQINKDFDPISIMPGETSRLSVTIFNPNNFQLTNAAWSDDLIGVQTGLVIANDPKIENSCGVVADVTAVPGSTTLSLINGTVPAQVGIDPGRCTVSIDVTSVTPGELINTIPTGALTSTGNDTNISNTTPASATLSVGTVQPPSLSKSFSPNTVWAGQTSQLTINIKNNDLYTDLTNASLTDSLPENIVVADPATFSLTGTGCLGTFTPTAGAASVSLTDATIPKNTTCALKVNVKSDIISSYTNTIPAGAIHSKQGVTNNSKAEANLNVQIATGLSKSFSPGSISAGVVSSLTIILNNPTGINLTEAAFIDDLPNGLTISNTTTATNSCGGSLTATAGTARIELSLGTIPASANPGTTNGTCAITVPVTALSGASTGPYLNTIPINNLTTKEGAKNTAAANATLTVNSVSITKSFSPASIPAGETSTLTITLTNPTAVDYTGAAFNDTLPTQLRLGSGTPVNGCGGSLSAPAGDSTIQLSGGTIPANSNCVITVPVTAPMSTSSGTYTNTIPVDGLTTSEGAKNKTAAIATLTIQSIGITKVFSPATIVAGGSSMLTITLLNPTGSPYTGAAFTDNLLGGLVVASSPAADNGCGGVFTATAGTSKITLAGGTIPASSNPGTDNGTCIIKVPVTAPAGTSSGAISNTIPAGGLTTEQGASNTSAATTSLTNQSVSISKVFSPTSFPAGSTSKLTITLTNPTASDYTGAAVSDTLPSAPNTNLSIVSGSEATTCAGGSVIVTQPRTVSLSGGTIPAGSSCTISVNVTTPSSAVSAAYTNTIPVNALTTTQGAKNTTAPSAGVSVTSISPVVAKSFSPTSISPSGNSRLRITITPPADTGLTNFSIVDNLPVGMTISNSTAASAGASCGVSRVLSAVTGASTISLTNGAIAKGASCQIDVYVTSLTGGSYVNTISAANITNNENRTIASPVSATLTVTSNLTISKTFYPVKVNPNGLSTLTIKLTNTNFARLVNVSVTDNLTTMGTLTDGVIIAPTPNASTTCGSGAITAVGGTQLVTMTGGTIPAQVGSVPGICTIKVDVQGKGVAATRTNTIPAANVTGTVEGTSTSMKSLNDATAPLEIANLKINIVKGFSPLTVFGGSASVLSVKLVNPNNADLSGIAFTDSMPAGMTIANPADLSIGTCGGKLTGNPGDGSFSFSGGVLAAASNCTLTMKVTMNVNGNLTNIIPAGAVTTFNGVVNPLPVQASLTNLPGASVSKYFSPAEVELKDGKYSTLTLTIQNTGSAQLTNLGMTDTFPDGIVIAGSPAQVPVNNCHGTLTADPGTKNISLSGGILDGNASCTVTVSVAGSALGTYQNCIAAGTLVNDQNAKNKEEACDSLTVIPPVEIFDPPTGIKVLNAVNLPELEWKMVWINSGNTAAISTQITDGIPEGTTYVSGSLACQVYGSSVTEQCSINNDHVFWQGTIGPDEGATDEATAKNRVVILFRVDVPDSVKQVNNKASSLTDTNHNGSFTDETTPSSVSESNVASWSRNNGKSLPKTGFTPGIITSLPVQPAGKVYSDTGDLWLSIPTLDVKMNIVGVPQTNDGWDVTWLGNEAGYLSGTAFPTYFGNSVLTGHVWDANNHPGPFANLKKLKYGDTILVHAWGQTYQYEVRENSLVKPEQTGEVTRHEDQSWVTLVTCEDYDQATNTYSNRRMVRAVLVQVLP